MKYTVYELTALDTNDQNESATVYGLIEVDSFEDKQDAIDCIERRKVYEEFVILEVY